MECIDIEFELEVTNIVPFDDKNMYACIPLILWKLELGIEFLGLI